MIHTEIPTTHKVPNISFFDIGSYQRVLHKVEVSPPESWRLLDVSRYGAILAPVIDGKEVQLTKKKVRWSEIIAAFFGLDHPLDKARIDNLKHELIKHGEIIVKVQEPIIESPSRPIWAENFWEKG